MSASSRYTVIKTDSITESIAEGFTTVSISIPGKKGKSGQCMIIDALTINDLQRVCIDKNGQEWLLNLMEGLRGKLATAATGGKLGAVVDSKRLDVMALISAMKQANESERMTKDSIGVWFETYLAELVKAAVIAKMPDLAADKLGKLIASYGEAFQSLAGRDVSMPVSMKEQLQRAIALLPADHEHAMTEKVIQKLSQVTDASQILDAL